MTLPNFSYMFFYDSVYCKWLLISFLFLLSLLSTQVFLSYPQCLTLPGNQISCLTNYHAGFFRNLFIPPLCLESWLETTSHFLVLLTAPSLTGSTKALSLVDSPYLKRKESKIKNEKKTLVWPHGDH